MKMVKLNPFKVKLRANGFVDGFQTKRELDVKECKYILSNILGINLCGKDDFDEEIDYREYCDQMVTDVNDWIAGKSDDYAIMEYAYDCSDEPLGMFNCIKLLEYLQKKEVI